MRPVGFRDLRDAARALLEAPAAARRDLCDQMLIEARAADAYVRRLGRLHGAWGDGSLGGRARKEALAPERWINDREYAGCLSLVLDQLAAAWDG